MVLVFGFGFPEVTGGLQFRYHSARPKPGCVHVGNRLFRNPFLLLACVKDGRTVAGSPVVPLSFPWRLSVVVSRYALRTPKVPLITSEGLWCSRTGIL